MIAQYHSAKEKKDADNLALELGAEPTQKRADLIEAVFVGRDSDGKLMKFAPGNHKKNEVVLIPPSQLRYLWWRAVT